MRTNKFLLIALATAGMFTACSNDDEVVMNQGNEISFRVQGGAPELRTTATTKENVDAFVVYGADYVTTPNPNIFDGITVARQVDGSFDYNPKKYFATGATTSQFAAFSPVSTLVTSPSFAYGTGLSFNYEVPAPDAVHGKTTQEDLLVAGTTFATIVAGTKVNFDFKHALSRIFVKATSELSETVTIRELTLMNLQPSGTITGAAPWTWPALWEWTPTGSKTPYSYALAPSGVAVPAGLATATLITSMEQGMMVIPQEVGIADPTPNPTPDADDFALKVVYDVANLPGEEAYIYLENGYEFEMGKQYAITIAFTADNLIEVNFEIKVSGFEDIADALLVP